MAKDVVLVVSPFLFVASRNVALLFSSFDASSTWLLNDDVFSAVFFGRLSDDQSYSHHSNSFADKPVNSLLSYSLDICYNGSVTSVPVEELGRLDQTRSYSKNCYDNFMQ